MTPTRLILADDHEVVRAGLRNALLQLPDLDMVAEVGTGPGLTETLARHPIDLLIVDVAMPDFEPISAVRQIKAQYPDLKVLVVGAHADESYVVGLLDVGVNGYHLKDQPLADLQLAVQRVLAGDRWISGPLVERLTLKLVRWLYRKRLRELIALVPADAGAEILAASENIKGPVGDVSLN